MGEEIDDQQTASLKNMMEDFDGKIKDSREEKIKNQKAIAFYGLAEEILGEKGVKQMAIKSILPPLNTEISKIIKTLGVEHRIVFNEDFDAKITHFGLDVSVDTLSTGELKKVDFAVLLAVIRMMKMKYPFMNMLFLDEIFSSIDGDGQYHILKILREIVKEYNMNIFVISHYPLSYTEFDYTIEITKNNGFSTFEISQTE
jgi:DNA repair exonuclease SbcCD ATPase subunit